MLNRRRLWWISLASVMARWVMPWEKGATGNPNGRPKLLTVLARRHTDQAIETLVRALDYPKERVPAAIALLDRGWGKPKETVEAINFNVDAGGIDAPKLPETLEAWLERRHAELAANFNTTTTTTTLEAPVLPSEELDSCD